MLYSEARLLRMETRGIKNIDKNIDMKFTNETFDKKILDSSNIKVIYGSNGAGKSALINSVSIYERLSLYFQTLTQDYFYELFNEILNKKINEYYIKMTFLIRRIVIFDNNNEFNVITHELLLKKKDNNIYISKEKLSKSEGKSLNNSEEITLYEVNEGEVTFSFESKLFEYIKMKTYNLLKTNTLLSYLTRDYFFDFFDFKLDKKSKKIIENNIFNNLSKNENEFFELVSSYIWTLFNVNVYLEEEEANNEKRIKVRNIYKSDKNKALAYFNDSLNINEDIILKSEYKDYLKDVHKLCEFIKLFKNDLVNIEVRNKIDNDKYHCTKIFDYGKFKLSSEYESSGIKKLIKLFNYIKDAIEGKIVFIDEFDANISGVYLNKLLEFISEYGKGQLVFTSHSFEPMSFLKKQSKSIDFLGETGKLVTWIKNGHYDPKIQYTKGMIMDSPFNIESFDFLKPFFEDDE